MDSNKKNRGFSTNLEEPKVNKKLAMLNILLLLLTATWAQGGTITISDTKAEPAE